MQLSLDNVIGIGKATADKLKNAGIDTVKKLADSTPEEIVNLKIKGLGKATAIKYINNAKELLEGPKPPPIPLNDLKDGELMKIKSSSSDKFYTIKNTYGIYSCTCLGWMFQTNAVDKRTCKHLRQFRGDAAEKARVGSLKTIRSKSSSGGSKKKKPSHPIMLAKKWDSSADPTGWYISEKLDGVRAYWDGSKFISRQGNRFSAPEWFIKGLPSFPLDGELFLDRGQFQLTVSIVKSKDKGNAWKLLKYCIFDAPKEPGGFEARLKKAIDWFEQIPSENAYVLEQIKCEGIDHMQELFDEIVNLGGEGVMLRAPDSEYLDIRSEKMLKFKPYNDAECIVKGYTKGTRKYEGSTGALEVELSNGTKFKIGSGLTKKQRENPLKIGSVVTFRYQELTQDGVPRFPVFLRVRNDVEWEDVVNAKEQSIDLESVKSESITQGITYYYELSEGTSDKFWEITLSKLSYKIKYGRIGTDGRSMVKNFSNESKAQVEAEKVRKSKEAKGYILIKTII